MSDALSLVPGKDEAGSDRTLATVRIIWHQENLIQVFTTLAFDKYSCGDSRHPDAMQE